nr:RNA-dependent RNA polymerase [Erysiphe necator associated negative-stranded RNA virus 19]
MARVLSSKAKTGKRVQCMVERNIRKDKRHHEINELSDEDGLGENIPLIGLFEGQRKYAFSNPELLLSPRKLDTALRDSVFDGFWKRYEENESTFDDKLILYHLESKYYDEYIKDPILYARFLLNVFNTSNQMVHYGKADVPWVGRSMELAYGSWEFQIRYMRSGIHTPQSRKTQESLDNMKSKMKPDLFLSNLGWAINAMENVVTELSVIMNVAERCMTSDKKIKEICKKNSIYIEELDLKIIWSARIVVFEYYGSFYMYPRPYILLMHNKLCDLFSVLVYAKLSEGSTLDDNAYSITKRFVHELAKIIERYRNNGYNIVRSLESLVIGETLRNVDDWDNDSFLRNVTEELKSDTKFKYRGSKLEQILQSVSVPFRYELGCLSKIVGHPIVNMKEGSKELHKLTTEQVYINRETMVYCTYYAIRNVIQTYVHRHKTWPLVEFNRQNPHPALIQGMLRNRDPESSFITSKYGKPRLIDYGSIEILPMMEFSFLDTQIPYIKDKTVSLCRTGVLQHIVKPTDIDYDLECEHGHEYYHEKPRDTLADEDINGLMEGSKERIEEDVDVDVEEDVNLRYIKRRLASTTQHAKQNMTKGYINWKETRLLLVYLLAEDVLRDYSKNIKVFDKDIDLDILMDLLVVKIVPKEKELKINYRGFGCLTPFMRHKNLAQEKNTKRYMELYCDEQASSLSELELTKKLYAYRNIRKAYKGYKSLIINIDASKWNTRWRHDNLSPVLRRTLDRIYNNKMFSKTQLMYKKTLFYVSDEAYSCYWDGHEGGVEGQNQDTWLYVYIQQIKEALREFDIPYHLLGRGDDMRIVLLVPPSYQDVNNLEALRSRVVSRISEILRGVNHKIKINDSYGSEAFFAFGKVASVRTVELPSAFRKIEKVYGANNAFMPLLDDYVANTLSNAHSASRASCNPSHCYLTGLTWTYYYLLKSSEYKNLPETGLVALSLIPSIVGGLPIIYLHNMYVRAESDLLSPFLGMMLFAYNYNRDIYNAMKNFLYVRPKNKPNLVILMKDPYAIQVDRPTLPLSYYRSRIATFIRRVVKNKQLKRLYSIDLIKYTKYLTNTFLTSNFYEAKVMSNLYSASPAGLVDEISKKFESARSVMELAIISVGKRIATLQLRRTLVLEQRLQAWRAGKILGKHDKGAVLIYNINNDYVCPALMADDIRTNVWKKEVRGVSMPPLQHQISISTPDLAENDPWARINHFTYFVKPIMYSLPFINHRTYATSSTKPFMGHITKTGSITPNVQFIEKDNILNKLQTLLNMLSWTDKSVVDIEGNVVRSNVDTLIYRMMKLYTDVTYEELEPFASRRRAGTIAHHIRAPSFRESIMPNMLSNYYQQVVGESNTHVVFRNSTSHYYVNFLHIYCYVVSVLFMYYEYGIRDEPPEEVWAITTPCDYCSREITEDPIVLGKVLMPPDLPKIFSGTSLGQEAMRILKASMEKFDRSALRNIENLGDIGINVAIIGVLQEIMLQTVESKIRLQDRYTHHPLTNEGQALMMYISPNITQKHIGLTEVKWIPMRQLAEYTMMIIYHTITKTIRAFRNRNVYSQIVSVPSYELPWYTLVKFIYSAGRLPSLITYVKNRFDTVPTIAYDSPESATVFLGLVAYNKSNLIRMDLQVVALSYYDRHTFEQTLLPMCYVARWDLYTRHIHAQMRNLPRRTEYEDLYLASPEVYLLSLAMLDFQDRDYALDWHRFFLTGVNGVVPLIKYEFLENVIVQPLEEEYIEEDPFRSWIFRHFREIDFEIVRDYIEDHLNELISFYTNQFPSPVVTCTFTTLQSCINEVRTIGPGMREPEEDDVVSIGIHEAREIQMGERINIREYPPLMFGIREGTGIQFNHSIRVPLGELVPLPIVDRFVSDGFVEPAACNRVFSSSTQGTCKAITIIEECRVTIPINGSKYFACLGEGTGGFLDCFASISQNSMFFYNSLQLEFNNPLRPHGAMTTLYRNGHNLIVDDLEQGLNDLTKDYVIDSYINMNISYDFITCDAEFADIPIATRSKLVRNVLKYIVNCSHEHTLACIKLYLNEPSNLTACINIARMYFRHSKLFRSPASNIGHEHYYIFYSRNDNLHDISTVFDLALPIEIHQPISRYIHDYDIRLRDRIEQLSGNYWSNDLSPLHVRTWLDSQGLLITRYLNNILGLDISKRGLMIQINDSGNVHDFVTSIDRMIEKNMLSLWNTIFHLNEGHVRGQAWDSNTLIHAWKIIEKYLCMRGFINGNVMRPNQDGDVGIPMDRLRDIFTEELQYLPERFINLQLTDPIFNKSWKVYENMIFPFEMFCKGVYYKLLLMYTYQVTSRYSREFVDRLREDEEGHMLQEEWLVEQNLDEN